MAKNDPYIIFIVFNCFFVLAFDFFFYRKFIINLFDVLFLFFQTIIFQTSISDGKNILIYDIIKNCVIYIHLVHSKMNVCNYHEKKNNLQINIYV